MSEELVPARTAEVASQFQRSGLFPDLRSEAQAYVKILAGQELGIGPMAAVANLNVIQGKVTFSANLLATMVKRHPAYDYRVLAHTDESCEILFLQNGEELGRSTFSKADAARAGLRGQNWTKYPKAMLFARALTQGVRWFCPDVTAGSPAYAPEELGGEVVEADEVVEVERDPYHASTHIPLQHQPIQRPREDRSLDRLAELVEEFGLEDDVRAALREFVKEGGAEAIDSAVSLLEDGNVSALLAGLEFEAAA